MRKNNLAAGDPVEQEERIEVNLDGKEGENITRHPSRGSVQRPRNQEDDRITEWEQKSRKVQKRLVQQARSFEQRQAEQQAEFNRQLALRDDRIARLERGGQTDDQAEAAHQKVMDDFEAKIAAAQEEGDSAKVAKLTREMSTVDSKFWAAQTAKATGGAAKVDTTKNADGTPVRAAATVIQPSKAGQKWAKANEEWFDDKTDRTHVAARAFANALYKDKIDAGDDKDEDEFYEEIRKEVEKRFPEIETTSTLKGQQRRGADLGDDDDDDDDEDGGVNDRQRQQQRRPASLSLPNRGDPSKNRANRLATITSAEQRQMKAVGLDPANNKHVMQYIASRNELEQDA